MTSMRTMTMASTRMSVHHTPRLNQRRGFFCNPRRAPISTLLSRPLRFADTVDLVGDGIGQHQRHGGMGNGIGMIVCTSARAAAEEKARPTSMSMALEISRFLPAIQPFSGHSHPPLFPATNFLSGTAAGRNRGDIGGNSRNAPVQRASVAMPVSK